MTVGFKLNCREFDVGKREAFPIRETYDLQKAGTRDLRRRSSTTSSLKFSIGLTLRPTGRIFIDLKPKA